MTHKMFAGWAWSNDGESYPSEIFASKDDAIADARSESERRMVYVGKAYKHSGIEWFPAADDIIERTVEALNDSDSGGEWSENWLETSKQARKRVSEQDIARLDFALKEAFGKWMDETGNRPDFYTVDEAEEVEINREEDNGTV